jgi:hypothetical protein
MRVSELCEVRISRLMDTDNHHGIYSTRETRNVHTKHARHGPYASCAPVFSVYSFTLGVIHVIDRREGVAKR